MVVIVFKCLWSALEKPKAKKKQKNPSKTKKKEKKNIRLEAGLMYKKYKSHSGLAC